MQMLTQISPKLPMRNEDKTKDYYLNVLKFESLGDYGDYLIFGKDNIEIHFFKFKELDPNTNYGQIYIKTKEINQLYQNFLDNNVTIHPNGYLQNKPWGQREFSLLDPDNNLLTFGQNIL